MSQYYSKIYRGFLIQQTDRGWVVPQLPNWSNGPVNQGPFSTYQIACHVLDRCLDNEQSKVQSTEQKQEQSSNIQSNYDDQDPVTQLITVIFLFAAFFAYISFDRFFEHPIRAIIAGAIALFVGRIWIRRL